jgi:prepilin-type N-terminal cleavage/methylation domain-containing protein
MIKRFRQRIYSAAGFSLVEILVVMVIMGLVVSAIMSLYVNMQKTSGSSDEVVEIQQGLRIALDRIALDLRMAGFLVTGNAISAAGPNSITLRSAASRNQYARISAAPAAPAAGKLTLTIDPPEMALMFDNGDDVRIVDPAAGCLLITNSCTDTTTRSIAVAPVSGEIKITVDGAADLGIQNRVMPEAMLVRADSSTATYPNTITYELAADPDKPGSQMLVRRLNGAVVSSANAMAGKISSLSFLYTMDDGTVLTNVPAARLGEIQSVRVVLQGTTVDSVLAAGGPPKIREAGTIVKLRNR